MSPPAPAPSPSSAAAGPFGALEKRLLAAKTLRVHARVVSGARPSDVRVVCDGVEMHGGSREHAFDFDAPPALREGIVRPRDPDDRYQRA